MKKIYVFSYHPKNDDDKVMMILPSEQSIRAYKGESVIYAITADKATRNRFMSERDMKKFTLDTFSVEDMGEDNVRNILKVYEYALLGLNSFLTYKIKNGVYTAEHVAVLTTSGEYDYISDIGLTDAVNLISEYVDNEYVTFNKKIRKVLFNDLICSAFTNMDIVLDDYAYEYLMIDELHTFIGLFGNTLKG